MVIFAACSRRIRSASSALFYSRSNARRSCALIPDSGVSQLVQRAAFYINEGCVNSNTALDILHDSRTLVGRLSVHECFDLLELASRSRVFEDSTIGPLFEQITTCLSRSAALKSASQLDSLASGDLIPDLTVKECLSLLRLFSTSRVVHDDLLKVVALRLRASRKPLPPRHLAVVASAMIHLRHEPNYWVRQTSERMEALAMECSGEDLVRVVSSVISYQVSPQHAESEDKLNEQEVNELVNKIVLCAEGIVKSLSASSMARLASCLIQISRNSTGAEPGTCPSSSNVSHTSGNIRMGGKVFPGLQSLLMQLMKSLEPQLHLLNINAMSLLCQDFSSIATMEAPLKAVAKDIYPSNVALDEFLRRRALPAFGITARSALRKSVSEAVYNSGEHRIDSNSGVQRASGLESGSASSESRSLGLCVSVVKGATSLPFFAEIGLCCELVELALDKVSDLVTVHDRVDPGSAAAVTKIVRVLGEACLRSRVYDPVSSSKQRTPKTQAKEGRSPPEKSKAFEDQLSYDVASPHPLDSPYDLKRIIEKFRSDLSLSVYSSLVRGLEVRRLSNKIVGDV